MIKIVLSGGHQTKEIGYVIASLAVPWRQQNRGVCGKISALMQSDLCSDYLLVRVDGWWSIDYDWTEMRNGDITQVCSSRE